MAGNLYGLYRAVVRNNVDPEQRHRMQVDVTGLRTISLPWAEACVSAAQGITPGIGDDVWVMFEAGDANNPVWIGVHPARGV